MIFFFTLEDVRSFLALRKSSFFLFSVSATSFFYCYTHAYNPVLQRHFDALFSDSFQSALYLASLGDECTDSVSEHFESAKYFFLFSHLDSRTVASAFLFSSFFQHETISSNELSAFEESVGQTLHVQQSFSDFGRTRYQSFVFVSLVTAPV